MTSLPPNHRMCASEIHWEIRPSSRNVRAYMTLWWPGNKNGPEYEDIRLVAAMVDIEAITVWREGGYPALQWKLDTLINLEHTLSNIYAELAYIHHKDRSQREFRPTSRAPGFGGLSPAWKLARVTNLRRWTRRRAGLLAANVATSNRMMPMTTSAARWRRGKKKKHGSDRGGAFSTPRAETNCNA